jgi:hypothetical protein
LTNHTNISTSGKGFHESLSTGFGDGTEIVDQITLGHTNTSIFDSKGVVGFVWNQTDFKVGFGVHDGGISQRLIPDLIKGIGGIGDQLSQEDFLVGVKGVDDKGQQLVDVSREGEGFLSFRLKLLHITVIC